MVTVPTVPSVVTSLNRMGWERVFSVWLPGPWMISAVPAV